MNVETTEPDAQSGLLVQAITDYAIFRINSSGIVTSWNSGAERAKGYSAAEILGQHFSLFYTPEDRAADKPAQHLATAQTKGRFEEEGWRVRKDGTHFWASVIIDPILDAKGHLDGFAKITRDLTERRTAQYALRRSERRFRLLMESVVNYAILTLDPDGLVTDWNPGAERSKGYTRDEILGQNFSLFHTPEDRAAGKPAQNLAAALTDGRFEDEGWRVRKDGTRFWANVVIEQMWDDDRQSIGFAKITRDITDKHALEEANEQLHQSQKMEAIGQLTGGVAHDFNNLLTVVMGSLALISKASEDTGIQRLVHTARRAVERGARLTSQLLAFARQQTLEPHISDVNNVITAFEELLRQTVGDGITLRFDLGSNLSLCNLDQVQFQSALLNIVINGRDAMPEGGTLTIKTKNVLLGSTATAKLTEIAPGSYVAITVRDTGDGMTPEVQARAIEPFYSTKDVGRGTGLGLSQVYGFVRQSNGQMEIKSKAGGGTSIIIYLPEFVKARAGNAEMAPRAIESGKGFVLVVEDDPDVLEVTVEAIRSLGFKVLSASNAAMAIKILQRNRSVELLFTDVMMPPGKNGIELAQEARLLRPALSVLLASGYPRDALRASKVLTDDMAFIAKPYSMASLSEELGVLSRGAPNDKHEWVH